MATNLAEGELALWQLAEIVDQFHDGKGTGQGELRRASAVQMYRRANQESMVLKSKLGEVAYWLAGTAVVVLGTWQFAMLVASWTQISIAHSDPTSVIIAG
jgi:hypothetical protein